MNETLGYYKNDGTSVEDVTMADYAQIKLFGGHAEEKEANVLVSASYYRALKKFKWYLGKDGYPRAYRSVDGKRRGGKMHKMLMGRNKGMVIDHINRNKLDNRIENLRICTPKENSYNTSKPKNSKNKYKGVKKQGKTGKWTASITKDKEKREIKNIATEKEAAEIYDMMAEELFGEYAGKNFN
jgi:hypothetical protein